MLMQWKQPCPGVPAGRAAGFTLLELAVVLAVIVILLALLLPGSVANRQTAQLTRNADQVRAVHAGLWSYSYLFGSDALYPMYRRRPAAGRELARSLTWGRHVTPELLISPFDDGRAGSCSYHSQPVSELWRRSAPGETVVLGDRPELTDDGVTGFAWGYNDNHVAIRPIPAEQLTGSDFAPPLPQP